MAQTNNYQEQFTESIRCRVPAVGHDCLQLPFRLGAAIFEFDAVEWTISSTINFSRMTWGSLSSLAMAAWE